VEEERTRKTRNPRPIASTQFIRRTKREGRDDHGVKCREVADRYRPGGIVGGGSHHKLGLNFHTRVNVVLQKVV